MRQVEDVLHDQRDVKREREVEHPSPLQLGPGRGDLSSEDIER